MYLPKDHSIQAVTQRQISLHVRKVESKKLYKRAVMRQCIYQAKSL